MATARLPFILALITLASTSTNYAVLLSDDDVNNLSGAGGAVTVTLSERNGIARIETSSSWTVHFPLSAEKRENIRMGADKIGTDFKAPTGAPLKIYRGSITSGPNGQGQEVVKGIMWAVTHQDEVKAMLGLPGGDGGTGTPAGLSEAIRSSAEAPAEGGSDLPIVMG